MIDESEVQNSAYTGSLGLVNGGTYTHLSTPIQAGLIRTDPSTDPYAAQAVTPLAPTPNANTPTYSSTEPPSPPSELQPKAEGMGTDWGAELAKQQGELASQNSSKQNTLSERAKAIAYDPSMTLYDAALTGLRARQKSRPDMYSPPSPSSNAAQNLTSGIRYDLPEIREAPTMAAPTPTPAVLPASSLAPVGGNPTTPTAGLATPLIPIFSPYGGGKTQYASTSAGSTVTDTAQFNAEVERALALKDLTNTPENIKLVEKDVNRIMPTVVAPAVSAPTTTQTPVSVPAGGLTLAEFKAALDKTHIWDDYKTASESELLSRLATINKNPASVQTYKTAAKR